MSVHDTARRILDYIRASAAIGATQPCILDPDPEIRALCAALISAVPLSLVVYSAAERKDHFPANVLYVETLGVGLTIHRAAPPCYAHADGFAGSTPTTRFAARHRAGDELVRLASIGARDLIRARAAHQPHAAIEVDGEPRRQRGTRAI